MGSTDSPLYKDKTLLDLAEKKNLSVQQCLLLWGLQHEWSVIPKSVTKGRIEKNFALDGHSLTSQEMKTIDNMESRFKVCGDSVCFAL